MGRPIRLPVAILLLLCAAALPAHAGSRVALVIGNDAYAHLPDLQKAANDARAMGAALRELGFQVIAGQNLNRRQTNRKLAEFEAALRPGDEAFLFFAGHGVAIGGENYLLPTDMPKPRAGEEGLVRDEGHAVNELIERIRGNGAALSFLVIDACRDNPFAASGVRSIGGTRGLTRVSAPTGVFVLFSAGIGQRALDRLDDDDPHPNSVFTRKLLPLLKTPGLSHVRIAKRVQQEVAALAASVPHDQQPAYYDQILGDVILLPGTAPKDSAPADEPKVAVGTFPDKAAPAQARQYKPGETFKDCAKCPEMVVVPAGSFTIGSPRGEKGRKANEGPPRGIAIAKPFAIGKFEVTFDEWDACVADGGCDGKALNDKGWGRGRRPVIFAAIDDANAYLFWLRRKTGKTYRLPSEAEWEYAARAGGADPYPFGANEARLCDHGNIADEHLPLAWSVRCSDGAGERTVEVGRYLPNAFGLHDTIGNVFEWVDDCWNEDYRRLPADGSAARTGDCGFAVYRGGGWSSGAAEVRSAARGFYKFRRQGLPSVGFRVVRLLDD